MTQVDVYPRSFWAKLGTLPGAAMVMVGVVAANLTLVAFGNLTDYGSNFDFVKHVLSMDDTFNSPTLMWRSIGDEWIWHAAYIFLISLEVIAAVLLLIGFFKLFAYVLGGAQHPESGKMFATLGVVFVLIIFGLGFLTIGGEWFAMWQSGTWNGVSAAARNVTIGVFALLLVHMPSAHWKKS